MNPTPEQQVQDAVRAVAAMDRAADVWIRTTIHTQLSHARPGRLARLRRALRRIVSRRPQPIPEERHLADAHANYIEDMP